ncbi:hypothetical protein B0H34DRAFT_189000 [Crassisporium funariophilum]|nr:hypothetical protein B0H34DRAFT_189000 [Crassisporium funariophilum]
MVSLLTLFTVAFLASGKLATALSPGSYTITNVQFSENSVAGTDSLSEGAPLAAFPFPGGVPIETNTLWTVNSESTTLQCELLGLFAVTDATNVNSGMSGAGVFTVAALNPQAPLLPIGTQVWEFIQGSNGIM